MTPAFREVDVLSAGPEVVSFIDPDNDTAVLTYDPDAGADTVNLALAQLSERGYTEVKELRYDVETERDVMILVHP